MANLPPPLLVEQARRNMATRGEWQSFAEHRQRVTELLFESAAGDNPQTLCVLGAGNCNDLDLPELLNRFERIHLVDCDLAALEAGVSRQGLADNSQLVLHGDHDLTGIAGAIRSWTPASLPAAAEIDRVIQLARQAPLPEVGEQVAVCGSVCVLSQLLEGVAQALGSDHPRFLDLLQAVRQRHLETIASLLAPGGAGTLITDLVSSATAPQIVTAQDVAIPMLTGQLISDRNFFTGLNPAVLIQLLASNAILPGELRQIEPISPWRWNLGLRTYLVYAIRFRRRIAS
ncbi:MAG: hypothetical protein SFU86_22750 [Pirellulaceae bacterium]|nr:hypothetical protein [Pirellulaceae bacterium]